MKTLHLFMVVLLVTSVLVSGMFLSIWASIYMVPSKIDEKFQLKINQIAYIQSKNLEITLLNVTEDSRCPSDVTCIWEGEVKVLINVLEDGKDPGKFTLVPSGNVEVSALAGYGIQLIRVDPYPISTQKIQPRDYTATFIVSRTENNILSPLKQFKSGSEIYDIKCKENLQLVFKVRDGSPACVKPSSILRLVTQGWTIPSNLGSQVIAQLAIDLAMQDEHVQQLISGNDTYVRAVQQGVSFKDDCPFHSCASVLIDKVDANETLVVIVNTATEKVIDIKTTPGWNQTESKK